MHRPVYGPHATVWLAERTDCRTVFVAVKITTAEYSPTTEAAMLEAVCKDNGNPYRVTLQGPDGTHFVLV